VFRLAKLNLFLASSLIGFQPNFLSMVLALNSFLLCTTFHFPINDKAKCAKGAKSPEAPSESCVNTNGKTSLSKKSINSI